MCCVFILLIILKVYKDGRNEPIYKIRKRMLPTVSDNVSVVEGERPKTAIIPPSRQGKDRFTLAASGRKIVSPLMSKTSRDNRAVECTAFESR